MEDVNGLWTIEFATHFGRGSGVAYFHDGLIHGGDHLYYYVGRYEQGPTGIRGTIEVRQYNSAGISVFGPIPSFVLGLTGAVRGDLIMAQGTLDGPLHQSTTLKLTRVTR